MKIFSLIITALLMFYGTALAKDGDNNTKKYPPYPDVWGYDLSHYPAMQNNMSTTIPYLMSNGDYKFMFRATNYHEDPKMYDIEDFYKDKFVNLTFFEGKISDLFNHSKQPTSSTPDEGTPLPKVNSKIIFSNGHSLGLESDPNIFLSMQCWVDELRAVYFMKRDEKGREIGKYSIIVANPNPQKILSEDDDDDPVLCGMPNNKYVYRQLFSLSWRMIKLEDDSFILYGDNNLIVRLKQDLTTPFAPQVNYKTYNDKTLKRNLFIIPYEVIHDIIYHKEQDNLPLMQGLQDGLIDYLTLKTQHINMRF